MKTTLVRTKGIVIGEVYALEGGTFQSNLINWSTGETKHIGDYADFKTAKAAITKIKK